MKKQTWQLPEIDPLSPYNWDFRTVPEQCVKEALHYEQLRSCDKFREDAVRFLDAKIKGKSVRWHLVQIHSGIQKRNTIDLIDAGKSIGLSQWDACCFITLLENDCAFPAPWTWLLEKGILAPITDELKVSYNPYGCTSIRPLTAEYIEFLNHLKQPEGYRLEIDFDSSNKEIISQFKLWLTAESKKQRAKAKSGKASSNQLHKLKQLAAYRLKSAGLGHWKARDFIAKKTGIHDLHPILPIYDSEGAWHGALKAAKKDLEFCAKFPTG